MTNPENRVHRTCPIVRAGPWPFRATARAGVLTARHRRSLALGMTAVVLLLGTGGCLPLPEEPAAPPVEVMAPVVTQREIYTVDRGRLAERLVLSGTVGAQEQSVLYVRQAGRLKAVHVRRGDPVAVGDPLAELEAGSLPYDVAEARLAVAEAELGLAAAQDQLAAAEEEADASVGDAEAALAAARSRLTQARTQLAAAPPGNPQALQAAAAQVEAGEAEYQQAREQVGAARRRRETNLEAARDHLRRQELGLERAQIRLSRLEAELAATRVIAPHNGTVISLQARTGDQVAAYQDLLVLAAPGPPVVRVPVDAMTALRIRPEMQAEIDPGDGNPQPVPAFVVSAPDGFAADEELVAVVAPAPTRAGVERLELGRRVEVTFIVAERPDALRIPRSAVRTYSGRSFVTRVLPDGTRQEVAVELGIEDGQYVEVLDGLSAGDQVVSR